MKCKNGWTKDDMIVHILSEFKGKSTKGRNTNSEANCLYRGPNGRKCAVGVFIPDEKYHPNMDKEQDLNAAFEVIPRYNLETIMPLDTTDMSCLQSRHDMARNDEECLANMILWIQDNVENEE